MREAGRSDCRRLPDPGRAEPPPGRAIGLRMQRTTSPPRWADHEQLSRLQQGRVGLSTEGALGSTAKLHPYSAHATQTPPFDYPLPPHAPWQPLDPLRQRTHQQQQLPDLNVPRNHECSATLSARVVRRCLRGWHPLQRPPPCLGRAARSRPPGQIQNKWLKLQTN